MRLENTPGEPALKVSPDRWSAKFDTAMLDVSSAGTMVRGSGKVAADVVLQRDALVLDGRIPMRLEYSLPDGAPQSAEFDVPLLVAVTRQDPKPGNHADELWSSADFNSILGEFTPRNATGTVFERTAITVPAAEIRQIRIPLPIRLVVSATNPLRIGFPLPAICCSDRSPAMARLKSRGTRERPV